MSIKMCFSLSLSTDFKRENDETMVLFDFSSLASFFAFAMFDIITILKQCSKGDKALAIIVGTKIKQIS